MWVVIVYPPLSVPWELRVPGSCPACGAAGQVQLHQRQTRQIQGWHSYKDESGELIKSYGSARFRCRSCGKTFSLEDPNRLPGSRLPKHVIGRVVAQFALGDTLPKIQFALGSAGIQASRASLNRVIRAVPDPTLRRLHEANHRRLRRAAQRDRPHQFWKGGDVVARSGELAQSLDAAPSIRRDGKAGTAFVIRSVVTVMPVYFDALARKSLAWVHSYLRSLSGQSGVLFYFRRQDLEREHGGVEHKLLTANPSEDYIKTLDELDEGLGFALRKGPRWFHSAIGSQAERDGRLPSYVERATRVAVRMLAYQSFPDSVVLNTAHWRNRTSFAVLRDAPADEDLFDEPPKGNLYREPT